MPIFSDLAATVGRTPLIELKRFAKSLGPGTRILGKLETRNPSGSVKDRIAIAMIRDAEEQGTLCVGATIITASSGNTGIALASAAAALGYQITVVMPESMSTERVSLLRMLGAKVVTSPGALIVDAVEKAEELVAATPKAVRLRQFENPVNPQIHRDTTALEIWEDCEGNVDVFVSGVGTGGTLTGVGGFLKDKNPEIHVVAVEPENCAVLSGEEPGPHYIQGLGAGFVPKVLNRELIDEVIRVSDKSAMSTALRLARSEGILAGISSGANLVAVEEIAMRPEMVGKTIVTILPDSGERYLSTPMASEASNHSTRADF